MSWFRSLRSLRSVGMTFGALRSVGVTSGALRQAVIILFMVPILLTSCDKGGKKISVEGVWELSDYQTKSVTIGEQSVSVYVNFISGGTFELYQKTGSEQRYTKYTGEWTLTDSFLSGSYDDGTPWASAYSVSVSSDRLTLESDSVPSEVMTFQRSSLP